MRRLINYIRSCFCKHDWKLLDKVRMWENENDKYALGTKWTYRCKKCGWVKIYKNY